MSDGDALERLDGELGGVLEWHEPVHVDGVAVGATLRPEGGDALAAALEEGWRYDPELLVERSIEGGTEVTCAVVPEGDLSCPHARGASGCCARLSSSL